MASGADLATLRELATRFAEDPAWIPDVSAQVTAAIHAELPELDADEDLQGATYASTESVTRLYVDMVVAGQPMVEAEPPPAAIDYAREFVRRGVGLDTLLRAYYIGHKTFFAAWMRRVHAELDDPEQVAHAIEEGAAGSFSFIQAVTGGLVQRYADERERWVRSAAAVRSETVQALLAGEPLDVDAASARLRYQLERPHVGFVVWSEGADDAGTTLAALERVGSELGGTLGAADVLLVPVGRLLLAGWAASGEAPPSQLRLAGEGVEALAALGASADDVDGFRRSHREAMHARRMARLLRRRPGSVTRYGDVSLLALASTDLDHARTFAADQLGALAADDDDTVRLAATLRVYLEEHASPRRAAQRLGLHENTIKNRIRAAQELLPHPIDGHVAELLVALRLTRAVSGRLGPEPGATRR